MDTYSDLYLDEEGVVNVAEGVIKQTKADYVKGAKMLYSFYGFIPSLKEAMEKKTIYSRIVASNWSRTTAKWFYDAERFVNDDPYEMFTTVSKKMVFNDWKKEGVFLYYLDIYREAAYQLYKKYGKFDICNSTIKRSCRKLFDVDKYISAKDYLEKYFDREGKTFESGMFDYHQSIELKVRKENRKKS